MEQIRRRARAGLMAAPRIGMGVGGLLIGVREESRVRLFDSIELPCSHSAGPSFNLTPQEKRESAEMIAGAGGLSASGKVGVVGWYCSKTRGDAVLNEADRSVYDELFPGAGPLALVLRPSILEPMQAVFFRRDGNGAVLKALQFEVDEWRPSVAPEPEAEPADATPYMVQPELAPLELPKPVVPKPAPPPKVVELAPPPPKPVEVQKTVEPPRPAEIPRPAETRLADIISLSDAGPTNATPARPPMSPAIRPELYTAPSFLTPKPRMNRKLRLALVSVVALLVIAAVGFLTRDFWMPKPPLTLTTTDLNGSVIIHWNPEALRGIDHASMFVNDGGQTTPSLIPLDRLQLNSGLLSYTPKSTRVTAKLDAGDITAIATWFAPPPPAAPATPAPADPASPPPPQAAPAKTPGNR